MFHCFLLAPFTEECAAYIREGVRGVSYGEGVLIPWQRVAYLERALREFGFNADDYTFQPEGG